jgi:hypothetical protein
VFVAHAQEINALCLLGTDGSFRYVADLDASSTPPLGYPSASWSTDGQRLVFIGPHQHLPGGGLDWLSPDTGHALYLATLDQPMPTTLGDTRLDEVSWREDGQLLGLWRPSSDSALRIRLTAADNAASGGNAARTADSGGTSGTAGGTSGGGGGGGDLLELPVQVGTQYAAIWDLPRAQLLIATRDAGGAIEFWLARLGAEDAT